MLALINNTQIRIMKTTNSKIENAHMFIEKIMIFILKIISYIITNIIIYKVK